MVDQEFRQLVRDYSDRFFEEAGKGGRAIENMVAVRTEQTRTVDWYRHDDLGLKVGDEVVVEVERGTALGTVVARPEKRWVAGKSTRSVVRRTREPGGGRGAPECREQQQRARRLAAEAAARHRLELKVVDVEMVPWENRTIIYFVSETRVDFRELVRELSRSLRGRIEMRQLGPRDETKMIGALARCGRELCCSSFLSEFHSVRTKMAKEQGLVVNQEKITGHCHKLLCCLAYEREVYAGLKAELPPLGTIVKTPEGAAKIVELQVIRGVIKVQLVEVGGYKEFPATGLTRSYPDGEEGEVSYSLSPLPQEKKVDDLALALPSLGEADDEVRRQAAEGEGRGERRSGRGRKRRSGRGAGGDAEGQHGQERRPERGAAGEGGSQRANERRPERGAAGEGGSRRPHERRPERGASGEGRAEAGGKRREAGGERGPEGHRQQPQGQGHDGSGGAAPAAAGEPGTGRRRRRQRRRRKPGEGGAEGGAEHE